MHLVHFPRPAECLTAVAAPKNMTPARSLGSGTRERKPILPGTAGKMGRGAPSIEFDGDVEYRDVEPADESSPSGEQGDPVEPKRFANGQGGVPLVCADDARIATCTPDVEAGHRSAIDAKRAARNHVAAVGR